MTTDTPIITADFAHVVVTYEPAYLTGIMAETLILRTIGLDGVSDDIDTFDVYSLANSAGWRTCAPATDHEWPNGGLRWGCAAVGLTYEDLFPEAGRLSHAA
jgi:hypothetical protein